MMKEYVVKEAGYAYVYISNDNATQVDVYFDEVSITYTPTNIIQYNEYYPFGSQAGTSWTRENNKNDYLYNEGVLNITSGWYETFFRQLFGVGKNGAQSVLDNIRNVKIPEGLSKKAMQAYRELINRVPDPTGTQAIRAKILDYFLK